MIKCVTTGSPLRLILSTESVYMTDGTQRQLNGSSSRHVLNSVPVSSPNDAMWTVYYDASGRISSGIDLRNKLYLY